MLLKAFCPVHGTVMARRSAYKAVGEFDPRFGIISDVDMWMRLAARYDVAMVPETLIFLRPREPNHPWNDLTWQIFFSEFEEIIFTNLVRNYGVPNEDNRGIWNEFHKSFGRRILLQIIADVYHGRWRHLRDAIRYLPKSKNPRASRIGKILATTLGNS